MSQNEPSNHDGFVKSPSAALRFTFVAAAYHPSTPHSSVPLGAGLRAGSRETRCKAHKSRGVRRTWVVRRNDEGCRATPQMDFLRSHQS
ncbi:MAG: hypothetical protein NTY64_06610 [Deltaproteobacteria bacterium]|nr:hypothetical protein [Deltaproteobacteria bacterium]